MPNPSYNPAKEEYMYIYIYIYLIHCIDSIFNHSKSKQNAWNHVKSLAPSALGFLGEAFLLRCRLVIEHSPSLGGPLAVTPLTRGAFTCPSLRPLVAVSQSSAKVSSFQESLSTELQLTLDVKSWTGWKPCQHVKNQDVAWSSCLPKIYMFVTVN